MTAQALDMPRERFVQRIKTSQYWDPTRGKLYNDGFGAKHEPQWTFVVEMLAAFCEEVAPGMFGIHELGIRQSLRDICVSDANLRWVCAIKNRVCEAVDPVEAVVQEEAHCREASSFLWLYAEEFSASVWASEHVAEIAAAAPGWDQICRDMLLLSTMRDVLELCPMMARLYPRRAVAVRPWLVVTTLAYEALAAGLLPEAVFDHIEALGPTHAC